MVSEDSHLNSKAVQRTSKKYMKKQRKSDTSTIHLSSPVDGQRELDRSSVRVYDDCQRVVYEVRPGDARTLENGAHHQGHGPCQLTSRDAVGKMPCSSDVGLVNGRGQKDIKKEQKVPKETNSMSTCDTISQPYSGPEDNSTDPHESLTETSTMTFVDARTIDDSGEIHSLLGVDVHVKEFVLIDDDDDGDMSLREKTVTDMSIMDGNAADLVCGRLLSISTSSSSDCKEESLDPEPPSADTEAPAKKQHCCYCTIL